MSIKWYPLTGVKATVAFIGAGHRILVKRLGNSEADTGAYLFELPIGDSIHMKCLSLDDAKGCAVAEFRERLLEALDALGPVAHPNRRYTPTLRPMWVSALPDGVAWRYVECPHEITHLRSDLPASKHRHGVIETSRVLTFDEQVRFDMIEVRGEGAA